MTVKTDRKDARGQRAGQAIDLVDDDHVDLAGPHVREESALQNAMDARRQRLLLSQSQVTGIKWFCLYLIAVCALIAIALVHSDNRLASILSMLLFATGVATAAHDRPFIGEISVSPDPLLQVMPQPEG
jgi:hypothetical protein